MKTMPRKSKTNKNDKSQTKWQKKKKVNKKYQ